MAMLAAAFYRFEEEQRAHSRVVAGKDTGAGDGGGLGAWQRALGPRPVRW